MNALQITSKSDWIGVIASFLCLVHCVATPFLFVAQAGILSTGKTQPQWWGVLDIIFLILSFIAVLWSAKNTSKKWMRNLFWLSWSLLVLVILNEKLALIPLMEQIVYIPSLTLVFAHLYNRKYCICGKANCHAHQNKASHGLNNLMD